TYTPASNYFGSDCIMFKANDGELDSNVATACARILSVNDPPVADDQEITMTANTLQHIELTASDIENDTLTYDVISQPSHGILFGGAPHISYLPNLNYVGTDEFSFKANDGNTTSLPSAVSLSIATAVQETEATTGNSGQFTIDAIPKISKFSIYADKSGDSVSYDFSGSINTLKTTTGEKVILQITLDDEEASKNLTHFGLYTNIRKTNSDITNSDAYLVFDMGLPLKVTDTQKIFKDVQLNTSYLGKSMIVDVILTFDKPMGESDIILEVWNKGRHPVYETIPSVLSVVDSEDDSGPNISGSALMPEKASKDPIKVFSTAAGKVTEIKNNGVLILQNKDMGIKISGFIDNALRGEQVHIAILRPDDSTYMLDSFLTKDGSYEILTKLNTKWESGFYEIQVNCMDTDVGQIQFFVTDKEASGGQYGGISYKPKLLSVICKYHHGEMAKEDLISYLQGVGLSQDRIDNILLEHRPAYVNPYTFYYLAGLIPLLYILVSFLSKKKPKTVES
ncbi:MAG: Ig-like domain-containing protein, partial [Nitrososphaerales archaeon]